MEVIITILLIILFVVPLLIVLLTPPTLVTVIMISDKFLYRHNSSRVKSSKSKNKVSTNTNGGISDNGRL